MVEKIRGIDAPLTLRSDMALLRRQLERGAVLTPTAARFLADALEDAERVKALLKEEKRDAA